MRRAIAVDFDGTLCENAWPKIGAPNMELISQLIEEQKNGAAMPSTRTSRIFSSFSSASNAFFLSSVATALPVMLQMPSSASEFRSCKSPTARMRRRMRHCRCSASPDSGSGAESNSSGRQRAAKS